MFEHLRLLLTAIRVMLISGMKNSRPTQLYSSEQLTVLLQNSSTEHDIIGVDNGVLLQPAKDVVCEARSEWIQRALKTVVDNLPETEGLFSHI
jgi:hypothetical protein